VDYARRSDEYAARRLKIRDADIAIANAEKRIAWAESVKAPARYPAEYRKAQTALGSAQGLREKEDWDGAIAAAREAINALAYVSEEKPLPPAPSQGLILPAQYTVRPWSISGDCFWNIAGRDWAYGDPFQWRVIYDVNKAKLPNPANPNLIRPGTVLDIPSIQGETRQGMWESGRTYVPLRDR